MMPFYFLIDPIALRGTISLPVLQMQILRPIWLISALPYSTELEE